MLKTTKTGHVTFVHSDDFKRDVSITLGDRTVSVPFDALRFIVAESVRYDLGEHIQRMKPADLLRRIA